VTEFSGTKAGVRSVRADCYVVQATPLLSRRLRYDNESLNLSDSPTPREYGRAALNASQEPHLCSYVEPAVRDLSSVLLARCRCTVLAQSALSKTRFAMDRYVFRAGAPILGATSRPGYLE
jgi:hypothetical protein